MAAVAGPTQEGCGKITKVEHNLPPILQSSKKANFSAEFITHKHKHVKVSIESGTSYEWPW